MMRFTPEATSNNEQLIKSFHRLRMYKNLNLFSFYNKHLLKMYNN